MALDFFILLPCFVSLFSAVLLMLYKERSKEQRIFTNLILIAAMYFFIDANYFIAQTDYRYMAILDMIIPFLGLSLFPLIFITINAYLQKKTKPDYEYLLFIPAIVFGTATIIIYTLLGIDDAAAFNRAFDLTNGYPEGFDEPLHHLQHTFCHTGYNFMLFTEGFILLIYSINKLRKHLLVPSFFVIIIIAAVRVAVGRHYLINHETISAIFAIFFSIAVFVIARIAKHYPTSEPNESQNGESTQPPQNEPITTNETGSGTGNETESEPIGSTEKSLAQSLIHYLIEEKAYLNPNLNINMIASELHTNRSYVSMVINQNLGKSLKTIVAEYRIQYAKTLLVENPNMTLEQIALQSGFRSNAQFVKKFKELEGLTPRQWAAKPN